GSNLITDPGVATQLVGRRTALDGNVLAVRPEHLKPVAEGGVVAQVRSRQFLGTYAEWWVDIDGQSLRAWIDPSVEPAETVHLTATQHRWVRET
ncbi:MAG TPA: TOBE domain-containing protein, partial [Rhodothermales bacterium]|nr:TOBE domain-containing protein [Rhodothermales bacterium]